jgi:hypothetical protein
MMTQDATAVTHSDRSVRILRRVTYTLMAVVYGVAYWVGYRTIAALLLENGFALWDARLLSVAIESGVLVFNAIALYRHVMQQETRYATWSVRAAAILSITLNVSGYALASAEFWLHAIPPILSWWTFEFIISTLRHSFEDAAGQQRGAELIDQLQADLINAKELIDQLSVEKRSVEDALVDAVDSAENGDAALAQMKRELDAVKRQLAKAEAMSSSFAAAPKPLRIWMNEFAESGVYPNGDSQSGMAKRLLTALESGVPAAERRL